MFAASMPVQPAPDTAQPPALSGFVSELLGLIEMARRQAS